MKIKKATKKDLAKLAELMIIEFKKPPYDSHWTKKAALESIRKDYINGVIYIAYQNKEVLGFVSIIEEPFTKPLIVIEALVVKSNLQRKGVGKFIISEAEKIYKKKGFSMVSLVTNKKASSFKFYKKQGYKESKSYVTLTKKL